MLQSVPVLNQSVVSRSMVTCARGSPVAVSRGSLNCCGASFGCLLRSPPRSEGVGRDMAYPNAACSGFSPGRQVLNLAPASLQPYGAQVTCGILCQEPGFRICSIRAT